MLIPLKTLVDKYNIIFSGILHVGAHECEELQVYEQYIKRDKIIWVEALADKVELVKSLYKDIIIENAVISDKVEKVTFNRSNNGQSSSVLQLGLHKLFHPHIWYVSSYETETQILEDIIVKYPNIQINFLSFDIQGLELKALKGMEKFLHSVDYIYTEVSYDYVYNDGAIVHEIDRYLDSFGFIRIETVWCENYRWGDAFYIRRNRI